MVPVTTNQSSYVIIQGNKTAQRKTVRPDDEIRIVNVRRFFASPSRYTEGLQNFLWNHLLGWTSMSDGCLGVSSIVFRATMILGVCKQNNILMRSYAQLQIVPLVKDHLKYCCFEVVTRHPEMGIDAEASVFCEMVDAFDAFDALGFSTGWLTEVSIMVLKGW